MLGGLGKSNLGYNTLSVTRINGFCTQIFAGWILARRPRSRSQNPAGGKKVAAIFTSFASSKIACLGKLTNSLCFYCSIAKRALGLVPWGALIACSFLLTGLIIFLVHAKNAADRSLYVLQLSGSDPTGLYPHRVKVFSGSYAVTAGLASGCLVASIYLAVVRLRQKINAEKKRGMCCLYDDQELYC